MVTDIVTEERNKKREIFRTLLNDELMRKPQYLNDLPFNVYEVAINIERQCFNAAIRECEVAGIKPCFEEAIMINSYSDFCYKFITGIDNSLETYSPHLIYYMISEKGILNPHMTAYELNPEADKEIRASVSLRMSQKVEKTYSPHITCIRCNALKVTFFIKQTAALDEPARVFFTCDECGKRW